MPLQDVILPEIFAVEKSVGEMHRKHTETVDLET